MDRDGDGIACESLPSRPFHKEGWFWPVVGGVGFAAIGGGGYLWSRRGENPSSNVERSVTNSGHPVSQNVTPQVQEAQVGSSQAITPPVMVVVNNDSKSTATSNATAEFASADDTWMTPEKARSMPYADYLRSSYWQAVRRNNIARADGKCKDCGRSDQVLQVHHISYEFLGREDDRYLIVLCAGCHEKRHDLPSPSSPSMNA